jgi:hypothetical protein
MVARLSGDRQGDGSAPFRYERLADGSLYICWNSLFDFVVAADGSVIWARPLGPESLEALQSYLLSQVLSFVLLLRNIDPLHATVVVVDGTGFGIAGAPGVGKSSLASAFLRSGHKLLSDDLLVLREEGSSLQAMPGIPRIKLFPDSSRGALGSDASGQRLNRFTTKAIHRVDRDQFQSDPVPLGAIFVLQWPSRSERVTVRRKTGADAFRALAEHTFNTVYREEHRLAGHVRSLAVVADRVPILSVTFPRRFEALPEVVDSLLARSAS